MNDNCDTVLNHRARGILQRLGVRSAAGVSRAAHRAFAAGRRAASIDPSGVSHTFEVQTMHTGMKHAALSTLLSAFLSTFGAPTAHAAETIFDLGGLQGDYAVTPTDESWKRQIVAFPDALPSLTSFTIEVSGTLLAQPRYLLGFFGEGEADGITWLGFGVGAVASVPGSFNMQTGWALGATPHVEITLGGYHSTLDLHADGTFDARTTITPVGDFADGKPMWDFGFPAGDVWVGHYTLPNGPTSDSSFLSPGAVRVTSTRMTFLNDVSSPIPEPSMSMLLVTGGLALAVSLHRQRRRSLAAGRR